MRHIGLAALFVVALGASPAAAQKPFKFPEGKHGKGELKYVHGLPVLTVAGTPDEIGEQVGKLALKPAAGGVKIFKDYLKVAGLEVLWPVLVRLGKQHFNRFPEPYRRELEAMAKSSGVDRDLLIVANCIDELRTLAGCSALLIDPGRSAAGGPLMGRNWDFVPLEGMAGYSLVTVYRPAGKRAFVTVGFPGLLAAGSVMNDAGLVLAANEVTASADKAPRLDFKGVPFAAAGRLLLEDCGSLADAEKWLKKHRLSSWAIVAACDKAGGAVFEVTTRSVHVRRPDRGVCVATNHFVCQELAVEKGGRRFDALATALKKDKLAVADVARLMHAAHQDKATMHTMVFEPRALRLHLALSDGSGPASGRPLRALELGPLFKR